MERVRPLGYFSVLVRGWDEVGWKRAPLGVVQVSGDVFQNIIILRITPESIALFRAIEFEIVSTSGDVLCAWNVHGMAAQFLFCVASPYQARIPHHHPQRPPLCLAGGLDYSSAFTTTPDRPPRPAAA